MLSILIFLSILFISWFILKYRIIKINVNDNVLFITAHPDDELMFFGPTLLCEIRSRIENYYKNNDNNIYSKIHLLCLSNGNYYGDGEKREKELNDALQELFRLIFDNYIIVINNDKNDKKILSYKVLYQKFIQITILNDSKLIDSPNNDWDYNYITKIIENYYKNNNITKIITFDQYGISGHKNHISIYMAIKNLFINNNDNDKIKIYLLNSIILIRKYLAIFDIIFTLLKLLLFKNKNYHLYMILSLKDYLFIVNSLRKHQSQMLWYRRLFYSSTSRYMFINTFTKI